MLSREQAKLVLYNQFMNVNDSIMTRYLEENAGDYDHKFLKLGGLANGIDFKPILIPDLDLIVNVRTFTDDAGKELYREVAFDDNIQDEKYEHAVSFKQWTPVVLEKNISIQLANEIVQIQEMITSMQMEDDFRFCKTSKGSLNYATYDVINNKLEFFGDFGLGFRNDISKHIIQPEFKKEDLKSEIDEASEKNPKFAQAASKCNLLSIMDNEVDTSLRLLALYEKCPALGYLYHDEILLNLYKNKILRAWNEANFLKDLNKKAKTLAELLRVEEPVIQFVPKLSDNTAFNQMLEYLQEINKIGLLCKAATSIDYEKIDTLIGLTSQKGLDALKVGQLTYLAKLGYTIKEIYAYLKGLEDKEAIQLSQGLSNWCYIINTREIYTGYRLPYKPINMHAETALAHRAHQKTPNEVIVNYYNNMIQKNQSLYVKSHMFDILPYDIPLTDETDKRASVVANSLLGSETLLYFVKETGDIVFLGFKYNAVTFDKRRFNTKHFGYLKKWAKENNVFLCPYDH